MNSFINHTLLKTNQAGIENLKGELEIAIFSQILYWFLPALRELCTSFCVSC